MSNTAEILLISVEVLYSQWLPLQKGAVERQRPPPPPAATWQEANVGISSNDVKTVWQARRSPASRAKGAEQKPGGFGPGSEDALGDLESLLLHPGQRRTGAVFDLDRFGEASLFEDKVIVGA